MTEPLSTVCLFGAHRWHRADVVHWAVQSGLRPLVFFNPGEEITERLDPSVRILLAPDPINACYINELANSIRNAVDGDWYVLALNDYVCRTAAELSAQSCSQCYSLESALIMTQKHLLRHAWNELCSKRTDLPIRPIPSLFLAFDSFSGNTYQSSASAWLGQEDTGPYIVKPDSLDASIGVRRAKTYGEAMDAAKSLVRELEAFVPASKTLGFHLRPAILIDQEVPRSLALPPHAEYTAHVLTRNGKNSFIGVSTKLIDQPSFTKIGQIFPAKDLPSDLAQAAEDAIDELLCSLKVNYAISNWDFIVTPDSRLALLEGHLRPAGDGLMDLIGKACGVSPYVALFDFLTSGDYYTTFPKPVDVAALFYLRPETAMEMVESVQYEFVSTKQVSLCVNEAGILGAQDWKGPISEASKLASVSAVGSSLNAVRNLCLEAAGRIQLKGIVGGQSMSTALTLPFGAEEFHGND